MTDPKQSPAERRMGEAEVLRALLERYVFQDENSDSHLTSSNLYREAKAALTAPPAVAQQAEPAKYDDVLLPFLDLMRVELHANSGKGDRPGWLSMSRETAALEIYYHVAKLAKASRDNDAPRIREHAADVANMSMMLLDVCGLLPATQQPSPAPQANPLESAQAYVSAYMRGHDDGWASAKAHFAPQAAGATSKADAWELLQQLVDALDGANWFSWETTHRFQAEWDRARAALTQSKQEPNNDQ